MRYTLFSIIALAILPMMAIAPRNALGIDGNESPPVQRAWIKCVIDSLHTFSIVPSSEAKFERSNKKIENMLLEDNRHKRFEQNYQAALEIFGKQKTQVQWKPETWKKVVRGLVILPNKDGSTLNRQAYLMKQLTGQYLLYSADFPWQRKLTLIFSGQAVDDLEPPEAGSDPNNNVVYASSSVVINGKLGPIEEHEFNHAYLNRLESDGHDTGILMPVLSADTEQGASTGVPLYGGHLNSQELYTYANQLKSEGNRLFKLDPKSSQAEDLLDSISEHIEGYTRVALGLYNGANAAKDLLEKKGATAISFEEEEDHSLSIVVKLKQGLVFKFSPKNVEENKAVHELNSSSTTQEERNQASQFLTQATLARFKALRTASGKVYNELIAFSGSQTEAPVDPSTGQWSKNFRKLIDSPCDLIFQENSNFLAQAHPSIGSQESSFLESKLIEFKRYFP